MEKSISKSILLLSAGTGLAQGISILSAPLLTRFYTPIEFGQFSLFLSITSLLGAIASGRFELAILLPKSLKTTTEIKTLGILYSLGMGLIIALATFSYLLFKPTENGLFIFWFIPVAVILISIGNLYNYFATRLKAFKLLSILSIGRSLSNNSISIVFGYWGYNWGLILGYIFGNLLFVISSYFSLPKLPVLSTYYPSLKATFIEYKDFPGANSLSALINISANQLPIIIMAFFFNDWIIGLYGLLLKVLNTPLVFLGKSISQVIFSKASKDESQGIFSVAEFRRIALYLFILITIILTPFLFYGESIFEIVFGSEWREAGLYLKYFIPFYIFRFIYFCLSSLLLVKKMIKSELQQNTISLILQLLALSIGCLVLNDAEYTFMLISTAGTISYAFFLFQINRIILSH